jgi:hypothetical protein
LRCDLKKKYESLKIVYHYGGWKLVSERDSQARWGNDMDMIENKQMNSVLYIFL